MKQVTTACCLAALLMAFQAMPSYAQYDEYDIYVYDWHVGTTVQVTSIPNRGEFNPAWSPDGTSIVHDVVQFNTSGVAINQHLAITDVASGVSTNLAGTKKGNNAAWHPEDGIIAFDRVPASDFSIYYVPASGGSRVLLQTDAIDPTWSRTGRYLAFHRPSEGAIYTLDLATNVVTFVDEGEAPFWDQYTDEYLTYTRDGEVFFLRMAGGALAGSPVQQTVDPAFDGAPTFSTTAKHIVFMTNRSGQFDLWVVYVFGGTPTYLTGSPSTDEYDPAGRRGSWEVAYAGRTLGPKAKRDITAQQGLAASSYPNPFNPATTISFTLPEAANVTLSVYDLMGREVATLVQGSLGAGSHAVHFDATYLPSGTYFYRVQAGSLHLVKQLTLLK